MSILVQDTIYRRLLIGRDGHLDQSEAYDSQFLIIDNHVKNRKCGNFVSISSLTGECAAQKFKKIAVLVYVHVYIIMVILRTRNKITDFFMILAWASPFKGLITQTDHCLKIARNDKRPTPGVKHSLPANNI